MDKLGTGVTRCTKPGDPCISTPDFTPLTIGNMLLVYDVNQFAFVSWKGTTSGSSITGFTNEKIFKLGKYNKITSCQWSVV